jgi:hypothetical protein
VETYKIVEKVSDGVYKFLFHDRRRIIKDGDTIHAEKKMVYEAYNKKTGNKILYESGIHVIETAELCRKYLKRFKDRSNKTIVVCDARFTTKKPNGNPGVLLADQVTFLREL